MGRPTTYFDNIPEILVIELLKPSCALLRNVKRYISNIAYLFHRHQNSYRLSNGIEVKVLLLDWILSDVDFVVDVAVVGMFVQLLAAISVAIVAVLNFAVSIVVADEFVAQMLTAAPVTVARAAEYIAVLACVDFLDVVTEDANSVGTPVAKCSFAAPAIALVLFAPIDVFASVFCEHEVPAFLLQLLFVDAVFAVQMLLIIHSLYDLCLQF